MADARRRGALRAGCRRWLGRFCLEAPEATLEDVQTVASTLAAAAMGLPGALDRLAALCQELGDQERVGRLLPQPHGFEGRDVV